MFMKRKGLMHAADGMPLLSELAAVTATEARIIETSADIAMNPGTADDACYLHSVLCQCGMPRRRLSEQTFERTNGGVSLLLTAGKLWDGKQWVQQPLPYGPKPRLILINLTSSAVMSGSRFIDVGRSTREFMARVGLDPQGSEYRSLRRQVAALSACRMQLGARLGDRLINLDTQPVRRFDVWITPSADQQSLWPGMVELSQEYFDSVREHAVPLDERAVSALRGTALGLDIYAWLAHRLHRVKGRADVSWRMLHLQFGQEYRHLDDFRKEFRSALRLVLNQYPDAKQRIDENDTGLVLRHSKPPIGRVMAAGV